MKSGALQNINLKHDFLLVNKGKLTFDRKNWVFVKCINQ